MPPKRNLDDIDDAQKELEHRVGDLERTLKWLLGGTGLTLVVLLGSTWWLATTLATVDTTVKTSSEDAQSLKQAVYENKDSLMSRTSVIETKLNTMDAKLDDLVKLREKITVKISNLPEPKPTPTP